MDAEQLREGGLFGLAELGELLSDVGHGTAVLAQLQGTTRGFLDVSGVPVLGQQGGQTGQPLACGNGSECIGVACRDGGAPRTSKLDHEIGVTGGGHETQCIECHIVVGLFEGIAADGRECAHFGGASATPAL